VVAALVRGAREGDDGLEGVPGVGDPGELLGEADGQEDAELHGGFLFLDVWWFRRYRPAGRREGIGATGVPFATATPAGIGETMAARPAGRCVAGHAGRGR
jgi:hypothetical protein